MDGSRLLLIDATGLLVRVQRAVAAKRGTDELALYLFARSVIRFINYHDPGYIVAAWDGPQGRKWRTDRYPAYKANRPRQVPESLDPRDGLRKLDDQVLHSLYYHANLFMIAAGIPSIDAVPFEADDIISWATRAASREGIWHQDIRSDDADMNQLVTDELRRQFPLHGDSPVIDADFVRAKYGCDPWDLSSVRALAGDPSDNIPGLPGIGPKKACKLLEAARWKLPDVDHPDIGQVLVFEEIMNVLARQDEARDWLDKAWNRPFLIRELCRWDPESHQAELTRFFGHYGMNLLLRHAEDGSLWTS